MPKNDDIIPDSPSPTQAKAKVKEMLDAANRVEKTTGPSGAVPLTPKGEMFDLPEGVDPDKHYRWVNIKDPQKVSRRRQQGYERVPSDEGGKQIGDEYALFRTSRSNKERRANEIDRLGRQRQEAHRDEMRELASQVAKNLRDKHGIKVDERRLLVDE